MKELMDMAQDRTINDILKELSKNYKAILLEAVHKATDIACEDIYKFSMSVLEQYYENYMPSRYDRTDSLHMATVPIAQVNDYGDIIESVVGVRYDPDILETYAASSYYEASRKYGNVDGAWVIENFLMGIHPATNGSSNPDTVVYIPWQDARSPDEYLKKYLGLYRRKFENNVNSYLISHFVK